MPSLSSEQSYTPETTPSPERYLEVERGDVSPAPSSQSDDDQNNAQQQTQQQSQPQQPQQQPQKSVDPVEMVKGMISAGFTPSKAQIMNATNNLSGPQDSTNTWFAIFLQRLIKQDKLRKSRGGMR